jgi:hypothetical protein
MMENKKGLCESCSIKKICKPYSRIDPIHNYEPGIEVSAVECKYYKQEVENDGK